eukprot:363687_1
MSNQWFAALVILLASNVSLVFSHFVVYTTTAHITIRCNGLNECFNITIDANLSTHLLVECNNSCKDIYINAKHAASLQLNCISSFPCRYSNISCPINNNSPCIINCIGKHACKGFDIHARKSSSLSIHCDGEHACSSATIYSNPHNTNITCISATGVCEEMWIHLYDNCNHITFNSFNIECLSNKSNTSCSDLKLMCYNYDYPWITTDATLTFNETTQQYMCQPESSDCCPTTNYTCYSIFATNITIKSETNIPLIHHNSLDKSIVVMMISIGVCMFLLLVIVVFYCIRKYIHMRNERKPYNVIEAPVAVSNVNIVQQIEQKNDDMIVEQHEHIELDINNYHQWNSNQVQKYIVKWIISCDEFSEYRNTLIKHLSEEEVDGECLKAVEISDINRWGIKNFKHSKELLKHIKILSDNQEGEIERSQEEGDEKTTRRESAVYFEINENEYNEQDNKEDILLDEMLSDILKMESLDPNKIHEMNVNNVIDKQNNDSDSENSDNMYE